jgi:hypothetical protein
MSKCFDKAIEGFLTKKIDLENDDIIAILIDTDEYTPNFATHQYLSSIPAEARISGGTLGTKVSLTNVTVTGRVVDADDCTFPSVTGARPEAIALCKRDTSTFENTLLVALIDDAGNMPITPGGGNIIVSWAAEGIFSIQPEE